MPYTISHVAAVVPIARGLARLRLLSAVVVGSMVPDFGYLMPVRPARFETHSAAALITFCLPIGLLTYWVFQRLVKTPLLSILSDQAYLRWLPYAAPASWGSVRQWLLAATGVLLGAVTHLAWDGFTHEDARGVRMVPELADPMIQVHGHAVTGARLLQDLSSLAGLVVVIASIAYALRGGSRPVTVTRTLNSFERRTWVSFFFVLTICFCAGFQILLPEYPYRWMWLANTAVSLLRGLILSILCFSILLQGYLHTKR